MQYRGKKLLGLLLTMLMIVSLLPAAALATEGDVALANVTDGVENTSTVGEDENANTDDTATPDEGENTGDDTATPDEGENTGDDTTTTALVDPTAAASVALEGAAAGAHTEACVAEVACSTSGATEHYATLAEALAAAHAGDTVKLLKDVTLDTALSFNVSVTLDLNGKTLTVNANQNTFTASTTIKNGSIKIINQNTGNGIFYIPDGNSAVTLTFEKVTVTGTNYNSGYAVFSAYSGTLTVNDSHIQLSNELNANGGVFKTVGKSDAKLFITNTSMNLHNVSRVITEIETTIKGSTMTVTGDGTEKMDNGINRSKLTVEDSYISMSGLKGRGITAQHGDVEIKNSSVSIKECGEATILTKKDSTAAIKIDTTSTVTVDATPKKENSAGTAEDVIPADMPANIHVDATVTNVASIAGKGTYPTLAAAYEAAAADDTIELLSDVYGPGLKVSKKITIDFKNYTYTIIDPTVGSTGTETNGFQLLQESGSVTMKNGVLKTATNGCKMLIQNYTDLTLENMVVDGTGSTNMLYVLSNNHGSTNITGSTSIKAPDGAVAFDVCLFANYEAPTVTVDTTGTINGKIEIAKDKNASTTGGAKLVIKNGYFNGSIDHQFAHTPIEISGGDFSEAVKPEWCADGFRPAEPVNGRYGVTNAPLPSASPAPTATAAPTAAPATTASPAPTAKPQSPKTGDEANLALWLGLAAVSALGLGYVVSRRKREE